MLTKAQYRKLGDILVSPVGLGTVKFGRNTDVKYPNGFELPSDHEIGELLSVASDCGINLLDTAPAYGTSEARLGRAIAQSRERWVLCTKTGERYDGSRSYWDFSAEGTRQSIETSLRNLGTDRLDVVLVHCGDDDLNILRATPVLETLLSIRDRGDIRYVGASTKTVEAGLFAVNHADVVMVSFGPGDVSQLPVIEAASDAGAGVLVKKALASGHAANPADALKFVLENKAVTSAIVGTIDPLHLRSNVSAIC